MINNQEHNTYITSSNGTKAQLAPADLSYFLDSCQDLGLKHSDFTIVIHKIWDHIIENTDERLPTRDLKIPLLFLRKLETLLASIKIN